MPNPWQAYIDDVLSGERIAGRLERLAVERFCRLCEKPEYYFDEEEADYIINLLSHFRHTKGKYYGKQWKLPEKPDKKYFDSVRKLNAWLAYDPRHGKAA